MRPFPSISFVLALTGEHELVGAIIRRADGNTLHLSSPATAVERVKSWAKLVLTLFEAVAASLVVGQGGSVVDRLAALFSFIGSRKTRCNIGYSSGWSHLGWVSFLQATGFTFGFESICGTSWATSLQHRRAWRDAAKMR